MDPIRVRRDEVCTLDQAGNMLDVPPASFRLLLDNEDLKVVGTGKFGTEYVLRADVNALKSELDPAQAPPVSEELAREIAALRKRIPAGHTILS